MSKGEDIYSQGSSSIDTTDVGSEKLINDRWSKYINYHQLVVSSCIGIVQVWWHPYIHDTTKLIPFIFMYNVFSVLICYPLFYLELAFGVVTKKSLVKCWDLAPIARGTAVSMLILCVYLILAASTVAMYSLELLYLSTNAFLPWLDCAASASHACSARHRACAPGSDTPSQSFLFNWVIQLKRGELKDTGLGGMVPILVNFHILCWLFVFAVACKKIYSYSKIILFKDAMAYFILVCSVSGVMSLKGSHRMFNDWDWNSLYNFRLWKEALEYSMIQMCLSQGTLIMLGSYCPRQRHALRWTASLAFLASKSCTLMSSFILGGMCGALTEDYNNSTINLMPGATASLVLWSDYTVRTPGSQFWAIMIFFTFFVLSISTTALLVETLLSSFTRKSSGFSNVAVLFAICAFFCVFGILIMCAQGGLHVLNYMMSQPISNLRIPIAAMVAISITYIYGQTTFCEDVFFAIGEYPNVFFRISWAVGPWLILLLFCTDLSLNTSWNTLEGFYGSVSLGVSLLPILIMGLIFLFFKCRVKNILSEK